MNMNNQNFGEFLQTKREQQKITLRQLAEKLDLSAPFLSDVEKGRRNSLDMDRLVMLRKILNLSDEEYQPISPHLINKGVIYNYSGRIREFLADFSRRRKRSQIGM